MQNSVESAMFFVISGEGDCVRMEGMLTLCLVSLYNLFTFFASALSYQQFFKMCYSLEGNKRIWMANAPTEGPHWK